MSNTYKLNRTCPACGVKISDKNKSGFCNKHRDRTGINNPFFGKTHNEKTRNILKEKCKIASIKKWKDKEYVDKVKKGLQSDKNKIAHTSDSFRMKQSNNAKKQMKNIEQLKIRSECMKKSWDEGKLVLDPCLSKDEIDFGDLLKEKLEDNSKFLEKGFKIKKPNEYNRFYFPDFRYKNYLIEFDGDFWHGHNKKDDDILLDNVTVKMIREKDELKNKTYKDNGFKIIRIWQSDYLKNKSKVIDDVIKQLLSEED